MADEKDDLELVRGSGNVFADFGVPDASLRQFRAVLAAEMHDGRVLRGGALLDHIAGDHGAAKAGVSISTVFVAA